MKKDRINKKKNFLKWFWNYLWHDDSLGSYVANFVVAFIFIKFLFFPAIGFILHNDYPIVAIVSGSMQHKIVNHQICNDYVGDVTNKNINTDEWWNFCGSYYQKNFNFTKAQYKTFDYINGLNIGDVMILYGEKPKDIKVGQILVFIPEDKTFFLQKGPVIHRVVKKWQDKEEKWHFQTKGDHNPQSFQNFETDIPQKNVIGVAVLRIPFIGYAKIALNNVLVGVGNLFGAR